MLHLLKYQFLQTIRSRSIMFWALAFPLPRFPQGKKKP